LKRRTHGCLSVSGASKFREVLNASGVDGQSEDEGVTYGGIRTALAARIPWRSAVFTKALRTLDYAHLGTKISQDGRLMSLRIPRCRETGPAISSRSPVSGLPENCYDTEWLSRLTPKARKDLDVRDSMDLSIPDELQRSVFSVCCLLSNEHDLS
jgi:hypothetical protein